MREVKLHDIGEGMTEGEIANYLVAPGDRVTIDQPVVEVSTDKMVAELPAPVSGTVKEILVPVGQTVGVGTALLLIEEEPERTQENATRETSASILAPVRVLATPYTRKIARDNGIKIEDVTGTDPSGRVTEEDVRNHIASLRAPAPAAEASVHAPAESQDETPPEPDVIPFRGMRRQIAKKMTASLFTIPHVTHFEEIDMTHLLALREELKAQGTSISVNAFFLKALVVALKDFPVFNAKLDEENERIILERVYHIGLATDTDDGLIVPVVRDVDRQSLRELDASCRELNRRAKAGELKPAELRQGTFTVSNVGPLGSTGATPIINHPETALIAFHKTKKRACVDEQDQIVVRSMMNVSMSFDHRVADGATAVAFTNRFAELIEQPNNLFMELI
ncbi:dihydrolipoamide acetyltransferase family protein [Exiguobacterium flavidum]|uniref:dihydrolipoamide acetyltransferase family protein n=1 Tax=Exiguobacterium flavidum TaxID=2184695 RepID=UPI000DF7CA1B|nr:dihydrolipoamide acetyltransferase family protein [Exiguobacterium flavidum]